jgi:beta-N-acetylhexosaminidase
MRGLAPVIFGLEGDTLTQGERELFTRIRPVGYILFVRNCVNPAQLDALTTALKQLHTDYAPLILIDQEGGRVARLKEPHWVTPPAPQTYADIASASLKDAQQLAREGSKFIGESLKRHGINVNCTPMCDIRFAHSHAIIGDRAYGTDAAQVIALAREVAEGLRDAGILPVIKHIPGHGRATLDSHVALPIVDASHNALQDDFAPFAALKNMPLAMTAHIIYTALDDSLPATWSRTVIELIRYEIGYKHLIMSDDICMKALQGSYAERTIKTLDAGCDIVLHCDGNFADMLEVASALEAYPTLSVAALNRVYDWLKA